MCTFIYYIHTNSVTGVQGVHDYVYELDIYADMNKAITVFVSLKSFDQRKLTMEKAKRHFILDFPLPNWVRTRSIGRWTATLAKCCLARVWGMLMVTRIMMRMVMRMRTATAAPDDEMRIGT